MRRTKDANRVRMGIEPIPLRILLMMLVGVWGTAALLFWVLT